MARAKKAYGAASAELASLAAEAEKAKLEDVAEAIYLDAFRIDPTHHGAEVFLRKRGYVLIFNYGAIPKDERDRVRKNLQTLGGDLLRSTTSRKSWDIGATRGGSRRATIGSSRTRRTRASSPSRRRARISTRRGGSR